MSEEFTFEVLATRTVESSIRAEVTFKVPNSVKEEDREDWVLGQLNEGKLTIADEEWSLDDEDTSDEFQEVTEM